MTANQESSPPPDSGEGNGFNRLMKGAYFYGSLLGTACPGFIGKKIGITKDHEHWSFITNQIILGALPVITKCAGSGDHLPLLREQLESKGMRIALVVAALESEEMRGFGLTLVQFAQEENWRMAVNENVEYHHISFEDTSAKIDVHDVALAVEHIHRICLADETSAVYVHCKAGKGRSWMIVMCYLTTYGGMSFTSAQELIKKRRPQVRPSEDQLLFASAFPLKFEEWKSTQVQASPENGSARRV